MKIFIRNIIIILIGSALLQSVLPWWCIVLVSAAVGAFLSPTWQRAFFAAFIAIFLLWTIYPLILSLFDDFKMAEIIGKIIGGLPSGIILAITGLVGGFVAGISALSSFFVKQAFTSNKS